MERSLQGQTTQRLLVVCYHGDALVWIGAVDTK